ncbi:MAG: bifunctional oligoribonuclease/PAP phosphatase NrnA, partial [Butyrivibrio sp.]
MKLSDLLKYKNVVIQCHNNPDADAIASGFGVYTYFKNNGTNVRLVYAGYNTISKANLCLMVNLLEIPIEYVDSLDMPELLITVDCQYGEGNVDRFEAENIAVIDHHQPAESLPELSVIRSNIGSCSTIVWDMLRKEGFDINTHKNLTTALYYGLLCDTNNFTEISHPLDKDLRDDIYFERSLVTRFTNTNLSLNELVIAGKALLGYRYTDTYRFAVVQAEPCDPNILGMISDLILEVDVVDTCVVYSVLPQGIKLSVRSCIKDVKACELASVITEGVGNGGGHLVKAGGFIKKDNLPCSYDRVEEFFTNRMKDYFANTEIIHAGEYKADISDMKLFRKADVVLGYVKAVDLFPSGTKINIRTLEGDIDVIVEDDIYIMIGIRGEVYPIRKEKFDRSYTHVDEEYIFKGEYEPVIRDTAAGKVLSVVPYAKACIATGIVEIYVRPLTHRVKVFTAWDEEKYMLGQTGDYLAIRKDDLH